MKPIKTLLLLACLLWLAAGAFGAQVDTNTAASTVRGWLRFDHKPLGASLGETVKDVVTFKDDSGVPLYHVVNLEPSGFVIVSAEDQVEPIIAFVEKGRFDPSPSNPLGALISRDVPGRVAKARAKGSNPMLQASRNKWQKLLQNAAGGPQPKGVFGSEISDLRVAPFINTLWDQGALLTVVSNNIWVNDTVWVTTYFTTNSLGDTSSSSISITNATGVFLITPGWPANHSFGGMSVDINVASGPDSTVTNFISVTFYIQIIVTNQFGDILTPPNTILTGSGTFIDVATGSTGGSVTHAVPVSIGIPLVVSDMKACYNYFTPPHWGAENPHLFPPGRGNIDNYPCGCVATAMAQLMYYHQWPATGVGTACYTFTVNGNSMGKNLLGGDYKGGPYKWNTMPLAPDYYSLTIPQAQAVGALTFDAGIAVHMQYTEGSSGAYMTDAKTALVNTFKYNNAIVNAITNLDTGCFECSLYNMMNPNLDARLPVLLGITGDPGGHAIVVDGYGYSYGMLYHHLNMGWSGAYNAWYSLPIIDMYDFYNDGNYAYFWNVTDCLYNVYTNGSGEIISGRVLDNNTGLPVANASVTANRIGGGTYTAKTDPNGIYALVGIPSASTFTLTVTNTGYSPASSNYSTATSSDSGTTSGNVWGADFSLAPAQGPPVITVQPANQFVTVGGNATFNVSATGGLPLFYQWQYYASGSSTWTNLSDGGNYSGSQTPTLAIGTTVLSMNGELLQCIVSNNVSGGSVTNSQPAVLTVSVPPLLTISTLAGSAGYNGAADGIGSAALFNNPRGIAVDNNTNVYVTDLYNHTIRKLILSGTNWVVNTIAGLAGSSGSADGTNSNARFNGPYGITVYGNNVYVADTGNSTIRELTPSGTNWVVSTIAGLAGSSGSTDGNNNSSRFRFPIGIAADSFGNLYVTDEGNDTIRELTSSGTNWVTSTLAGLVGNSGSADGTNSSARFNGSYGITVYGNDVYVADKSCSTIRKLKQIGVNWVVSTIAGLPYNAGSADGIGGAARFNNPAGIAVDGSGNLYVADQGNSAIRRLWSAGTNWVVFTVAGLAGSPGSADGIGSVARFNGPYAIAADSNTNVYVADSLNSTIRGTLPGESPLTLVVQIVRQTPGKTCMLTWNAMIGHTYLVQFKTNMLQTVWYPLTSVTASNLTGSTCIPIGPDPQRFYRIVP